MKKESNKQENKNVTYGSIRVKELTKKNITKVLEKANKTDDCGKVTMDILISHLIEKVTPEDIQKLQLRSITWEHEDRRLKTLWEKKKGKITESKWKEMLYIGQLKEFIQDNSRLQMTTI
ncbi:MAG: hypothetical protein CME65_00100 [Halobacteriovoraceae bacterium]|nr:hypothetical protein [Halobacteriovoraceae bacterium]|tara:strand:+ start:13151 stop:13510 length:360 start_codon:yes stop_codon:yes gene_type:complete